MKCGEIFNYRQGGSDTCGEQVWGDGSPNAVCPKCKDKLIVKLAGFIDMDKLELEEYGFITDLMGKST